MKLTLQGPPCGCPSRPTVILSVTSLGAPPRSRHRQECSLIPHGDFVWFHADILYRAGMQAAYVVNTPWPFHGSCIVFHDCTIGAASCGLRWVKHLAQQLSWGMIMIHILSVTLMYVSPQATSRRSGRHVLSIEPYGIYQAVGVQW